MNTHTFAHSWIGFFQCIHQYALLIVYIRTCLYVYMYVCLCIAVLEVRVNSYVSIGIQMSRIHYHHNLAYLSDARLMGFTCRALVHLYECEYKCANACADPKALLPYHWFWWRKLFLVLFIFSFHSFVCWSVESVAFRFQRMCKWYESSVWKSQIDDFVYHLRCCGRHRRHHYRHCYRCYCCSMMMMTTMMMTVSMWVCVCVRCCLCKHKTKTEWVFKHIVWFLVETLNNCHNSLLWSLLQSGC